MTDKFCIDCKHYKYQGKYHTCSRSLTPSPVTGIFGETVDDYLDCVEERASTIQGDCQEHGEFWRSKVPPMYSPSYPL